jgi:hypothetical protein
VCFFFFFFFSLKQVNTKYNALYKYIYVLSFSLFAFSFCLVFKKVVLSDGYSYERRHVEQWLEHKDTSPISGAVLHSKSVIDNITLKKGIDEYFKQMFSLHRQKIRKAAKPGGGLPQLNGSSNNGHLNGSGSGSQMINNSNDALLRTVDSLMELSLLVNADLSPEDVLRSIVDEAKELIGAEVASVFLIDREKGQLYSTINSTGGEIRIPLDVGIAGHVAKSGKSLVISDAYSDPRFYSEVDEQTGFKTDNILCVPIKTKKGIVIGVAQLINKLQDFNDEDEHSSTHRNGEGSSTPHTEFSEGDERFLFVFASQAAAAIASSVAGGSGDLNKSHHRLKAEQPAHRFEDTLTPAANQLLEDCLVQWQTDVISLSEITEGHPLSSIMCFLFQKLNFIHEFEMDFLRFRTYFLNIELGYGENPYHNREHAASVVHMTFAMLHLGGINDKVSRGSWFVPSASSQGGGRPSFTRSCGELVMMTSLFAAAVHDFEHLGLTNSFLTKSNHSRAITYNDMHVNEHHHAAAAFKVLQQPECNFMAQLVPDEFRVIRKLTIDMVLATDMEDDKFMRNTFQEAIDRHMVGEEITDFDVNSKTDALLTLQMTLKSADLGHLALAWDTHVTWVERLENEFFYQGDKEASLGMVPISFLMDRSQPGVTQTQLGFFEFVAVPLFSSMEQAFPLIAPMVAAIAENFEKWRLVTEYYPVA